MQRNDNEEVQSMETGDTWYFDEFGEYRNASLSGSQAEDIDGDSSVANDSVIPAESTPIDSQTNLLDEDEFNETLTSPHVEDQLNDPMLQDEAETEYTHNDDRSFMDKVKDKIDDIT